MLANLSRRRSPADSNDGEYEEYHPYGSTAWWSNDGDAEVSRKRYRYTGMERDEETGLQCHGVRYYAPWLGRWMSADPIGLGDGVNRYAYCHGNPVSLVDPAGMGGESGNAAPQERVWPPPVPPAPPETGNANLPKEEVERRIGAVLESANAAEADAPLSAKLIRMWVDQKTPAEVTLSGEDIGLSKEDSGFQEYLRSVVRPRMESRIRELSSSLTPGETMEVRFSPRDLTPGAPASHSGSTKTGFYFDPYKRHTPTFDDPSFVTPMPTGADLATSLGNVQVAMKVTIKGNFSPEGNLAAVDITGLDLGIVDRYDFHLGVAEIRRRAIRNNISMLSHIPTRQRTTTRLDSL